MSEALVRVLVRRWGCAGEGGAQARLAPRRHRFAPCNTQQRPRSSRHARLLLFSATGEDICTLLLQPACMELCTAA